MRVEYRLLSRPRLISADKSSPKFLLFDPGQLVVGACIPGTSMHRLPPIIRISCNGLTGSRSSRATVPRSYKFLRRQYATGLSTTNTNHEATNIAVLGGGITGLASAYFLSRSLPNASITLIEASSRLGGWLHSKKVDVGAGSVVFEQGPRNLRPTVPNGLITLDLVCLRLLRPDHNG